MGAPCWPCPHTYRLERTWSTMDRCGNLASQVQLVDVQDVDPPTIIGVPPDAIVPCDAVPAPASPTVEDGCDPDPQLLFDELRIDGPCADTDTLLRTWTAQDACGNVALARQSLEVVDETAPVVGAGETDLACVWPPAHGLACFRRADFEAAVLVSDDCSEPITWRLDGCASDQPENGLGDGNTAPDCLVDPAGEWICVRAERTGLDGAGRRYAVAVVAVGACGNESAPTIIGNVHVPHDSRDRPRDCHVRPSALVGRGDPLPF